MTTDAPKPAFNLFAAWKRWQAFLGRMGERFGEPTQIYDRRLPRAWRQELKEWIEAAESALRRLLYLIAHTYPPPGPAKPRAKRAKREKKPKPARDILYAPFRLSPPEIYAVSETVRRKRKPHVRAPYDPRRGNLLSLARRMQAMDRVLDYPDRYAKRMAALLRKRDDGFRRRLIFAGVPYTPAQELVDELCAAALKVYESPGAIPALDTS